MQAKKTSPVRIVRRVSLTEKLVFTAKPSPAMLFALREAGFKWNGVAWWRNANNTTLHRPTQFPARIAANDNAPQPESVTA